MLKQNRLIKKEGLHFFFSLLLSTFHSFSTVYKNSVKAKSSPIVDTLDLKEVFASRPNGIRNIIFKPSNSVAELGFSFVIQKIIINHKSPYHPLFYSFSIQNFFI